MILAELLRRWALLEPQRCMYCTDRGDVWYSILFDTSTVHIEVKRPTKDDYALLQSAVQLAVEKRGWFWSILYPRKGVYRAGITMAERYMNATARFPALAVLAAYLKALELVR